MKHNKNNAMESIAKKTEIVKRARELASRTGASLPLSAELREKIASEKSNETTGTKPKKSKKTKVDTEVKNAFTLCLESFEKMYIDNGCIIPHSDMTAYNVCKAVTFSVLKKLIQVSSDKVLEEIRRDTTRQLKYMDNLTEYDLTDTCITFDSNGNIKLSCSDEYAKAVDKCLNEILSQGYDLINECYIALVAELEKATERGEIKNGFLTSAYSFRKMAKQVIIENGKHTTEWVTVETTPIQQMFKAVRKYIQSNKSIRAVINGYSYIEGKSIDTDSEEIADIFYRLDKYADLGGEVYDFNGKEIAYTVKEEEYKNYKAIVEKLHTSHSLSQKHSDYIRFRLQGKSKSQIGNKMGVSARTVERIASELQEIAISMGIGDESMTPTAENASKPKKIKAIHTESGEELIFDSVKECANTLSLHRPTIIKVLNGERKQTKNYTFKYITE